VEKERGITMDEILEHLIQLGKLQANIKKAHEKAREEVSKADKELHSLQKEISRVLFTTLDGYTYALKIQKAVKKRHAANQKLALFHLIRNKKVDEELESIKKRYQQLWKQAESNKKIALETEKTPFLVQ